MTAPDRICFRCDWEGPSEGEACPRCGAPLYRAIVMRPEDDRSGRTGATEPPPAATVLPKRSAGADGDLPPPPTAREPTRPPAEVVVEGDDGTRPRPSPGGRTLQIAAVLVAVALVAAYLSTRNDRAPVSPATSVGGTLVYVSAGGDGATGRLWRVSLSTGRATPGPRTVLPDQIVASGPGERWVGVRAGGAAYVFRDLTTTGTPELLADGQLVAWAPGGNAVFVVTREASASGQCPQLRISFVDSLSHGQADMYEGPSCSKADGLAVDGLTRPFLSLDGPTDQGVYELGYKQLHLVVPSYRLLSVSTVGDMLVGPRPESRVKVIPPLATRALLAWRGVGGPTAIGGVDADLLVERFLAWSHDGHRAAVLGTMGGVRTVWMFDTGTKIGREVPVQAAPAPTREVGSVGAAFAGDTLISAVAGRLYTSTGRGFRELELPPRAPTPFGPLLWLDR